MTSTMRLMVCATRMKKVSTSWKSWLKRPLCWGGAISLQQARKTCEIPVSGKISLSTIPEEAEGQTQRAQVLPRQLERNVNNTKAYVACMTLERMHSWMRQAGLPVVDRNGD